MYYALIFYQVRLEKKIQIGLQVGTTVKAYFLPWQIWTIREIEFNLMKIVMAALRKIQTIPFRTSILCRSFSVNNALNGNTESHRFVVAGGGAGGLAVASYLSRKYPNQVAVVEPADYHYYQPLWTLVGAGLKDSNDSVRQMGAVMPSNCTWVKEKVMSFDPDSNTLITNGDRQIKYEYLVVALGLQLEFEKLPGLVEALGTDGVGCIYSIDTVNDTYNEIKRFNGGNAFFTLSATPVKCLGAPQKIMYLAEEIFKKNGIRDKTNVVFKTPGGVLFSIEKYREALLKVCEKRNIQIDLFRNLISIDPATKEATFEYVDDTATPKKTETLKYDFIHITPPMAPVSALKTSPLSDAAGFVEVDPNTCQHVKYPNVFSLGDSSNLAVSKTAAAVGAQSDVVRKNLTSLVNGKQLTAKYDGYTSCPLVTTSETCILAEFDYTGQPHETFPLDQGVERQSMYFMKANVMPEIYWNLLLKGYWPGPEPYRKLMHFGRV